MNNNKKVNKTKIVLFTYLFTYSFIYFFLFVFIDFSIYFIHYLKDSRFKTILVTEFIKYLLIFFSLQIPT